MKFPYLFLIVALAATTFAAAPAPPPIKSVRVTILEATHRLRGPR